MAGRHGETEAGLLPQYADASTGPQNPGSARRGRRAVGTLDLVDRLRLLADTRGYFTRPDVLATGLDDKAIRRALRSRVWTRIRQGVYTDTVVWAAADAVTRHRLEAHAVAHRLGGRVALSHVSAAVLHGLSLWDVDLSGVHVTRVDGTNGRTEAGVVHHEGRCAVDELDEVDGVLVVPPARAALEVGLTGSIESAVVTLDSALRRHCTVDDLVAGHAQMGHWPGTRRLHIAVRLADGGAESVGESRARFLCYLHDLPAPMLQFEVYDECGQLAGIADFAWPDHHLLGEFDGRVKYGRLLRAGEGPADAVFREKRRRTASASSPAGR